MRKSLTVVALVAGTLIPSAAFAWNDVGHMTVALIAYRKLSPEVRQKVDKLLAKHPAFDEFKAEQPDTFTDEGAWVFMMASTWPDAIKSAQNQFHDEFDPNEPGGVGFHSGIHDAEHFIDIPYVPDGDVAAPKPGGRTILKAINDIVSALNDNPEGNRANAAKLSFLIHFLGDVHQPLHCATRFNGDFPTGDRGGNEFVIRVTPHSSVVVLHTFWDDLIGRAHAHSNPDPELIAMRAKEIIDDLSGQMSQLQAAVKTPPETWADESLKLAKETVYLNNEIKGASRAVLKHAGSASVPVVQPGYEMAAMKVAHVRIALAGLRLADQVTTLLGD